MTILELVKQLDTLTQDYKRQVRDLPKSYVRGTEVFKEAVARTKANYLPRNYVRGSELFK